MLQQLQVLGQWFISRRRGKDMTYIILKSRPQRYSKEVIWSGLEVLARYEKEILSYCRELPRLPLQPEEIVSDLLIDRMPRFVDNMKKVKLQELMDLLSLDMSAVSDKNKYRYNMNVLTERVKAHLRKSGANTPEHLRPRKEDLQVLEQQVDKLNYLWQLKKTETKVLAYIRSCVRRTKIKYLQSLRQTTEGRLTINADPTNGMRDIPQREQVCHEKSVFNVVDILRASSLASNEREVIMLAVVYEYSFPEIGMKLGCSRSSAARLYQIAMQKFQRNIKETVG